MWIGTGDGLNRYDGSSLQTLRVRVPKGGPPASVVRGNLCEDSRGNIWFSSEYGVYCLEAGRHTIRTVYKQNSSSFPDYSLAALARDVLWFYSSSGGFYSYDLQTGAMRTYPFPDSLKEAGDAVADFAHTDAKGHIWFLRSTGGGAHCFQIPEGIYTSGTNGNGPGVIGFGHNRRYLLTGQALFIFDAAGQTLHIALPEEAQHARPYAVTGDRWGRVWLSLPPKGLFCYDPAIRKFTHYQHSNLQPGSLPIDLTTVLFIDRADNLWVGTDGGGVSRLDLKPPRFRLFPLNEGDYPELKDYFIKCFYEDTAGNVWFGTHANGLCRINLQTGILRQYGSYGTPQKQLKVLSAIEEGPDGKLWLGHAGGITRFDPEKNSFEDVSLSPGLTLIPDHFFATAFCALSARHMLAATRYGLVLCAYKDNRWQGRRLFAGTPWAQCAIAIRRLKDGSIWVAYSQAGLLKLRLEQGNLRVAGQYFKGLSLRGLHADEQDDHILWVATTNGFARLDTRTGHRSFLGEEDGMSNAFVYGILEDRQHHFWMPTNGGLIRYDRKAKTFNTFTYADGLQSNEFNSGACYKGRSGTLYFGGVHGFNWISPETRPPSSAAAPQVALSSFAVRGIPFSLKSDQRLSLQHDQNDVVFKVAVLDYSRPEANKIAYWLQGWDRSWSESPNPEVHYANLPPGRYRLLIRGANAAGVWSGPSAYAFVIRAAFYQTGWFYALVTLLLLAAGGWLMWHFIKRKSRKQQQIIRQQRLLMEERGRISKDMHDEIGSGLTRIAMMSEALQAGGSDTAATKGIALAARSLVQSMGEIIWALNPVHDSLESLLAYLREQLYLFLEPFGVAFDIDFPNEAPPVALSNVQRRNIYLTAKEAVNNALKHGKPTAINVIAKIEKQEVIFEVCDDGCGFDPARIRHAANGLNNMQRRIAAINGWFRCHSRPGQTCISFGLPLKRQKIPASLTRITTYITFARKKQPDNFEV